MGSNGHSDTHRRDVDKRVEDILEHVQEAGYAELEEIIEHLSEDEDNESLIAELVDEVDAESLENGDSVATDADNDSRLSYIASDDAITLYFREVGTVPLLTREQEATLAQQIERGNAAKERLQAGGELSQVERAVLEDMVEAGARARDKLIVANTRLVISLAKKYLGQGVPLLDLVQEGNIGLMHAVEKFDWRLGHKFSTYATWWIRQSLTRAIADQGRTIRLPVHRHEQVRKLRNAMRMLTKELGREPTSEELAEELGESPGTVERLIQHAQHPMSLEKPISNQGDNQLGEFLESGELQPADIVEEKTLASDVRALLSALPSREARIIELRYGLRDGREYTLKEVGERFGLTRERIRQIEQDALHRLRSPNRTKKLRAHLT